MGPICGRELFSGQQNDDCALTFAFANKVVAFKETGDADNGWLGLVQRFHRETLQDEKGFSKFIGPAGHMGPILSARIAAAQFLREPM